jgi:P4 family phage/plasmid primase-like protien
LVKQNGNLLELNVGRVNGDYVHRLLVNREEVAKEKRQVPFWEEPFEMNQLTCDLLDKIAKQAMAEGILERICRTCRTPLETNGKPQYVQCETCDWFFCPDCHVHFARPTRCWGCWKEEVGEYVTKKKYKGSEYDAVDAEALAEKFIEWSSMIRFSDTGDTYIFDFHRLKWVDDGERLLEKFFYRTLKMKFLKNKVRQYITGYVLTEVTRHREEVPRLPLELIPAADCFVHYQTKQKVDIDPSKYFYHDRHTSPFLPGAKCELFDRFVREITSSEDEGATLEELMGFCLWRSYDINAIFIFVGEGANGKTTFVELLNDLIGRSLCSAEDIFNLTKIRFAAASLVEKNANLCADMPDGTIFNTAILKKLTGGDVFQAEKKNKDSFPFVNFAKLVFSCNTMPTFVDVSYGFWRRMKIIKFRYEFSLQSTPEEARIRYMAEGDPCYSFAVEQLKMSDRATAKLEVGEVYHLFREWCSSNGIREIPTKQKLGEAITRRHGVEKKWGVLSDHGTQRVSYYQGLMWRDPSREELGDLHPSSRPHRGR